MQPWRFRFIANENKILLDCYTVLDFTDERGEIGPMLLGDLGANVIRVELPEGSEARNVAPYYNTTNTTTEDDLRSLQFVAFNRNKRSITLDPGNDEDQRVLEQLITKADFIFTSRGSRELAAFDLDFDKTSAINHRIVQVIVSAFGNDGPHADLKGNDLVIAAMGGPVSLQGVADRQPVRVSAPQVWRHAGVESAAGAMVAHRRMLKTGKAQFVDVSAQCAMTWTMLNGMDAYAIQGYDFERSGSFMSNMSNPIELVHPTSDGYIVALPNSKVIMGSMEWMIEEGVVDDSYRDIDWLQYDATIREPDAKPVNLAEGNRIVEEFLVKHTKDELYEFGLKQGISLCPVNTLKELLDNKHIKTRDYWVASPISDDIKTPGVWCKPSIDAISIRQTAPALNQHGSQIRAELQEGTETKDHPAPEGDVLPFDGIKVADFSWVGVGPISAKYLADHGATVTRVESEGRPDVLRGGVPMKGEPHINHSQFYGDFNTSKRSMALDMKSPASIEIAKKLISQSDVMIESFAPGAIERMGLNYDEVKKLNPSIIMVSTCLMGQTGPAAGLAGYGYHAAAIAGFYELTGYPDRAPSGPWVAYTDTIAPRFIQILLASALDRKRRTGEGCYIDVAQIETALHFLAPELLDFQLNGTNHTRMTNRSSIAAPQGCYPCTGEDKWCAIAVDTDDEWMALAAVIGFDGASMPTNAERLTNHDEIDAAIRNWTSSRSAEEVMQTLQHAGVPAGVVQRSSDLLADKQYKHRGFYRYHDHGAMGNVPYAGHQYRISDYDNGPRGPAPLLGEHSYEVLMELGLADEEIAEAYASGVIN